MGLEPGEAVFGGSVSETRDDSNVSAGAAVTLSSGAMADVDTDANELTGICGESGNHILDGVVVAAADAAVAEGERVAGGNTTNSTVGVFETSSGGPGVALSAAGGTWQGMDVPDGYAVIKL